MTYSIVIPTKNRIPMLVKTVESVIREAGKNLEAIVIVNDGGSLFTAEDVVRMIGFTTSYKIKVINSDRSMGVSYSRNIGAREVLSDMIVFVDDDIALSDGWLLACERAFEISGVAAATGPIDGQAGKRAIDKMRTLAYEKRAEGLAIQGEHVEVDYLSGGNCAIERKVFEAVGGFDPFYVKCQDRELGLKCKASGHKVIFSNGMSILHSNLGSTLLGMVKGRYQSGYYQYIMNNVYGKNSRCLFRSSLESEFGMNIFKLMEKGFGLALCCLISINCQKIGAFRAYLDGSRDTEN